MYKSSYGNLKGSATYIDTQLLEIRGGGGPWGFGQILGGGPLFLPSSCFIAFLCDNFSELTTPPPYVHLWKHMTIFFFLSGGQEIDN
jgi:hypothetical protein